MSGNPGGGRGPQSNDDKRPARQTGETSGGAIKQPQHALDRARDIPRGAEPSTGDASRRR